MSDSKIQIKIGKIEFSGEGNQEWLSQQLDKILSKISEESLFNYGSPKDDESNDSGIENKRGIGGQGLSVLNIAGKLNAKSGAEVAVAAAAHLHFVKNKIIFSREELSSTMKEATGIYKNSMLANLTTTLAQLEKNGVFNKSSNSYSLNSTKVAELNAALFK